MTVACLSSADAVSLLADAGPLPAGVDLVVWDGRGPAPARLPDVEFWVPDYMAADPEHRAAMYRAMPALRVVQLVSAGADAFTADLPPGVQLCDAQGAYGAPTSEWVMAAVLAVIRELPGFLRSQERARWSPHQTGELIGARVLVLGAGDLGRSLARRLEAFEAVPTLVARRARDGVHAIADVPALLPDADIVVLVLPLTDATRGLVDAAFLARMRDGALLVNAARGPVVDTAALLAELRAGRLRAALDVVDPEPLPAESELWHLPNVLITPHVGGNTTGSPGRSYAIVRSQLERFAAGRPLENVVTDGY